MSLEIRPPNHYLMSENLSPSGAGVVPFIHPGYNRTETSRAIIEKFQRTGAILIRLVMREHPKHQSETLGFIGQIYAYDKFAKLSI